MKRRAAEEAARRAAEQATAAQVEVDPRFFKRVMALVGENKRPVFTGLAGAGLLVAGGAMVVAAIRNAADPRGFFQDRSKWNEILGDLKLSAWDVWITYFSEVAPYWMGHGSETVQRYLRFELIGMFDELGRVATEISSTLTSLAWDVMDYDMKLVGLLLEAGTVFTVLLPFRATVPGKIALGAAATGFLKLLLDLMKEFAGKMKALDLKLETLGHKVFELRGLFSVGDGKLHLKPVGYDANLWVPVTKEHR
ncbi:hypothetical protein [Nonomuraea roseoviolacea]|uniref:Uncharacterized protein n=1 Tax=Nonomuraea roseoviolacea subsp. carminata TaxID=160689 RepID=A0ABT1K1D0_9ACTN|nr:hypothetical protein [Nonomuraea roseoviolacea]MCP2347803.1 hypothetical protein [Nonomuraea roseoviolacea subsp. carminata]